MFEEFLRNCPIADEIKPSKRCVKNNIAALNSLIEKEEKPMTKRRLKPLIIAAVIAIVSAVSLVTVNAATKGALVKFLMGGKEIEGEYYDYVDGDGYRHVSFGAVLPHYEEKYAIIYDVDAPQGENVRVITEDTDPEFMENLRLYVEAHRKGAEEDSAMWDTIKAWKGGDWDNGNEVKKEAEQAGIIDPSEETVPPNPEDFGLVFKDSELCIYHYGFITETQTSSMDGGFGGKFMHTGAAYGKPAGTEDGGGSFYDYENEIKTIKQKFYYYVGKE